MSEIKKLVPKRRFKEFENAGSWEERKLGELGLIYTGNTPSTKDENNYFNNGMMWVTPTDIDSNIIYDTSKRLSQSGINKARIVPKGTILVTCIASIGKNALLREESGFNQQINSLTPNENNDSYFLLTQSELWSQRMRNIAASGTMQIVNKSEFSNLEFMYPNYKEQQKIGSFFQKFDDTIAFQKRKLEKMKSMKSAYLSEMFPAEGERRPKRRFPEFTDDWEERELGNTLEDLKSGLSRKLSNDDIGLPVVRANNINDAKLNLFDDIKYWYKADPQGATTANYFIQKNDILINFINSESKMGTGAIVEYNPFRDFIYTTNILRVRLLPVYDTQFWFALTQTKKYKCDIRLITKPAVNQASFTTVDYKKLKYNFPSLTEQQKIGNFFHKLDKTIDFQWQKLEKLRNIKKAYLREMFI